MRQGKVWLRGFPYTFGSVSLAIVAVLIGSNVVSAEGVDLLRCRRVDAARIARAAAEIETTFGLDGRCRIRGRARELCAPAYEEDAATRTSTTAPTESAATIQRLCFRLRCRKRSLPTVGVTDRFGRREIRLDAPESICLPVTFDDEGN